MDLFEHQAKPYSQPLAEKLRPKKFADLIGQRQIFEDNKLLFKKITGGHLQSLILWGPPGCGKTSFATALINEVDAEIFQENAIDLGAKRIREIGNEAKRKLLEQHRKSVLFVDEIHRLNRGQQDVLLPFVEKGYFYLVGATTENPSYQINGALMSRCRLLVFESLSPADFEEMIDKGLKHSELARPSVFTEEGFKRLCFECHGDARKLYNYLEEVIFAYQDNSENFPIDGEGLSTLLQNSGLRFDKAGDEHYDTISAFIKSIRGSDPDAGVYYLARMLEGGEDPVFIARRLVILASEDIGNADPQALNVAVNVLQAVELVGMPEARISLAQAVTYLSAAPKSNSSYQAIDKALAVVKHTGPLPIPKKLRSSQTKLMKQIGHGVGYKYTQDGETGWLEQDYFPEALKDREFYSPSSRGFEKRMQEYLDWVKGNKKN